jgi:hypothetical protein
MKILSSSSQSETQGQPLLRSKRRRRSVLVASLRMLALLGLLSQVRMLEFGEAFQKMSAAPLSVEQRVTVLA